MVPKTPKNIDSFPAMPSIAGTSAGPIGNDWLQSNRQYSLQGIIPWTFVPFGNLDERETFTSAMQVDVMVSPGPQAAKFWFQNPVLARKTAKIGTKSAFSHASRLQVNLQYLRRYPGPGGVILERM